MVRQRIRAEKITIPPGETMPLTRREALAGVADDFIQSVIQKKSPLSNAMLGRNVVRILEASQESIKNQGKEIRIKK